jgi:SHS2 domain-containing protein
VFEILEHPADIGFRARGRTLEELFEASAEALISLALEIETVQSLERYALSAVGEDIEALLVNWLSEVLWLLDGRQIALRQLRVTELGGGSVRGEAQGEPRDPARHRAKLMVKGVTYHQLEVARDATGWRAQVFLDI